MATEVVVTAKLLYFDGQESVKGQHFTGNVAQKMIDDPHASRCIAIISRDSKAEPKASYPATSVAPAPVKE